MSSREEIIKIIEYGTYAPSSHNSQPWRFLAKENHAEILPDYSRRLPVGDKQNRQLFISLGCAAENIAQAARAFGYETSATISGEKAIISFGVDIGKREPEILEAIKNRITSRYTYTSDSGLNKLTDYLTGLGDNDTEFFVCSDELKRRVAAVAIKASVDAMKDTEFRKELSEYVKSNTTKSKIGMPAYGMGIPTIISYIAPVLLRFVNVNRLSQKSDTKLLTEQTPYLVVMATEQDNARAWIKTGFLYERASLTAERMGLSTAMWAAPIETGGYFMDLQKILGTNKRPQALFRLGRALQKPPHSPRLTLKEVILE